MRGSIAIVGPGCVGQTLARALRRHGYRIGVVAAHTKARAAAAARFIGGGKPANSLSLELVQSHTILLTVPDGRLEGVARELARVGSRGWRGKVVLHTSGSRDARSLRPLKRLGARCGSFHPLFPFPQPMKDFPRGVFFALEGDQGALRRARELGRALGGTTVRVSSGRKPLYHAAGALAAGHLLTLVDLSVRVLERAGLAKPVARTALLALVRATIEQYAQRGERAWTGPLARGDMETVWKHVAALEKLPPHFLQAYAVLARAAVALYRKKPVRLHQPRKVRRRKR